MNHRDSFSQHPEPSSCSRTVGPSSPRSTTENDLARSVAGISRQLLETFAFSRVDQPVGDVAHMREYLLAKFPDPIERPLQSNERSGLVNGKGRERRDEKEWVLAEYKGAIYGKQCLESQEVILEYLLGKCLEQCRMCLEELRETRNASRTADESMAYVLRYGKSRGVDVDAPAVNAESAMMFKRVRQDLHELAEELKELDDSRKIAAQFLRNPGSVLPLT